MTQEEKQLLVQDLCARLPYGVIVKTTGDNESYILLSINMNKNIALIGLNFDDVYATSKIKINEVKPYLRSMSSMTDEECYEWNVMVDNCRDEFDSCFVDYCNRKHFDYRGLIEKGLAIEVTKENNPYKN